MSRIIGSDIFFFELDCFNTRFFHLKYVIINSVLMYFFLVSKLLGNNCFDMRMRGSRHIYRNSMAIKFFIERGMEIRFRFTYKLKQLQPRIFLVFQLFRLITIMVFKILKTFTGKSRKGCGRVST